MPTLHRRRCLQSLMAAGAAPLLPAPVLAAAPAKATHAQILWASLFARAGNLRTPAEVARIMNVSPATAQGIFDQVSARGVAAIANPAGAVQTRQPGTRDLNRRAVRRTAPRPQPIDMAALMRVVTRNMAEETAQMRQWRPRQDSNLQPAP